jgi:hypothetical protein
MATLWAPAEETFSLRFWYSHYLCKLSRSHLYFLYMGDTQLDHRVEPSV